MTRVLIALIMFSCSVEAQEKVDIRFYHGTVLKIDTSDIVSSNQDLMQLAHADLWLILYSRYEKDCAKDTVKMVPMIWSDDEGHSGRGTSPIYRKPTFPGFIEWLRKQK